MYRDGVRVREDLTAAADWFERAAAKGHAAAGRALREIVID